MFSKMLSVLVSMNAAFLNGVWSLHQALPDPEKIFSVKKLQIFSAQHNLYQIGGFWVLVGRLPDGDLFFRCKKEWAGCKGSNWANTQIEDAMQAWVVSQPFQALERAIEEICKGLEAIDAAYNAGKVSMDFTMDYELEARSTLHLIDGELQKRTLTAWSTV